MKYPKRVNIIELENAPFRCAKDAVVWAKQHGIVGVMSNDPKAYSYEISNIEVLKGNAGVVPLPSDKTSMDVDILLNGVCDVNGVPLVSGERRAKSGEKQFKIRK